MALLARFPTLLPGLWWETLPSYRARSCRRRRVSPVLQEAQVSAQTCARMNPASEWLSWLSSSSGEVMGFPGDETTMRATQKRSSVSDLVPTLALLLFCSPRTARPRAAPPQHHLPAHLARLHPLGQEE